MATPFPLRLLHDLDPLYVLSEDSDDVSTESDTTNSSMSATGRISMMQSPPSRPFTPHPQTVPHPQYEYRSIGERSIYPQLEPLFSLPGYLGHPDILAGVTLELDDRRNGTFVKQGKPFRAIVFGEMASHQQGTRLSAYGDMGPDNALVSSC